MLSPLQTYWSEIGVEPSNASFDSSCLVTPCLAIGRHSREGRCARGSSGEAYGPEEDVAIPQKCQKFGSAERHLLNSSWSVTRLHLFPLCAVATAKKSIPVYPGGKLPHTVRLFKGMFTEWITWGVVIECCFESEKLRLVSWVSSTKQPFQYKQVWTLHCHKILVQ